MKVRRCFILLISFCLTLSNCSKDEEAHDKFKSTLKIGSESYTLQSQGFLLAYGGHQGNDYDGYRLDLFLYEEGLKIYTDPFGYPDSTSGKGISIHFTTYSRDSLKLDNGNYALDTLSPFSIHTFSSPFYCLHDSISLACAVLIEGTLEVQDSREGYILEFDGLDQNKSKVEGKFRGSFKVAHY